MQALLPHHLLAWLASRLARARFPPLKNALIAVFRRAYPVDLAEAAEPDPRAYPTFSAFFTRALQAGVRPVVAGDGEVACPVDGEVSQVGELRGGALLQAKGREYELTDLLGGSADRAAPFSGGGFATLYLAPRDYHRVHMPLDGRLLETVHVPGRRFAVNPRTARDGAPALHPQRAGGGDLRDRSGADGRGAGGRPAGGRDRDRLGGADHPSRRPRPSSPRLRRRGRPDWCSSNAARRWAASTWARR